MSQLTFGQFCNLIVSIDDPSLFDAVKPELQRYARHYYPDLARDDAYREIFALSFEASIGRRIELAGNINANIVERMGKGESGRGNKYEADRIHAERLYFFFLSTEFCSDRGYAKRISETLFEKSFDNHFARELRRLGIRRAAEPGDGLTVRFGPLTIAKGPVEHARHFGSVEHQPLQLGLDGELAVLAALDWRAGLTTLHGRDDLIQGLKEWALDTSNDASKVMLLSGEGGTGKTRLGVELAQTLIHDHNWSGGFLPRVFSPNDVFVADGHSTIVLIDYPEERSDLVATLLKAIEENTLPDTPIKWLLISREKKSLWLERMNREKLLSVSETSLFERKLLHIDDAVRITDDVFFELPSRLGATSAAKFNAREWLLKEDANRTPIIALAAAIHAVLFPSDGFRLKARDVLIALAKIERQRLRSYSKRDFSDPVLLEKFVAASLLTDNGFGRQNIEQLIKYGFSASISEEEILRQARTSNFWADAAASDMEGFVEPAPHIVGAALFFICLYEPLEKSVLKIWILSCFIEETETFGVLLERLCEDLKYVSDQAPLAVVDMCIDLVNGPTPAAKYLRNVSRRTYQSDVARLAEAINRFWTYELRLFRETMWDVGMKVGLANNLHVQGKYAEAIAVSDEAVDLFRTLRKNETDDLESSIEEWLNENGRASVNGIGSLISYAMLRREIDFEKFREIILLVIDEAEELSRIFDLRPTKYSGYVLSFSLYEKALIYAELGREDIAVDIMRESLNVSERKYNDPHEGIAVIRKLAKDFIDDRRKLSDEQFS